MKIPRIFGPAMDKSARRPSAPVSLAASGSGSLALVGEANRDGEVSLRPADFADFFGDLFQKMKGRRKWRD